MMNTLKCGVLVALLFAVATAQAQGLKVETRGGVSVAAGGIGETEQAQFKAREQDFNLKLVFTLVEGNYVADVGVVVRGAAGKTLLTHLSDGPLFLAKLPAGSYSVVATYRGRKQEREVKVGGRLHTEYFRWPSVRGADFPLRPERMSK